jgi:hypothetical protein
MFPEQCSKGGSIRRGALASAGILQPILCARLGDSFPSGAVFCRTGQFPIFVTSNPALKSKRGAPAERRIQPKQEPARRPPPVGRVFVAADSQGGFSLPKIHRSLS